MDIFTSFISLIVIIILLLGLRRIILEFRKPKSKNESKDELIYNRKTGSEMTIEQAKKGHFINHNNQSRIKSAKEIDKYYNEVEREGELIRNYFIKAELLMNTRSNARILEIINSNSSFVHYNSVIIEYSIKIGEDNYLLMVDVGYSLPYDEGLSNYNEKQLVGITGINSGVPKIYKSSKKATLKEAELLLNKMRQ